MVVGTTAVCQTAATDPPASIELLRQCITPGHLQTVGYRTLHALAMGVPAIAGIDANFVHDLYLAALRHQDTSTTVTTIGDSQIMPFISNQQQDYRGGLYQLGQHYRAFLQAAPTTAATTLVDAIKEFTREHQSATQRPLTVRLDDAQATFVPDRAATWDTSGVYEHELPITMLSHLQAHLELLADQPENQIAVQTILHTLTGTPLSAIVWRRLLIAGTNRPATLGRLLRSLAWDPTILKSPETTRAAGAFARAVHPTLDSTDRERIEHTILSISTTGRQGTYDRDRLLGCLDQAHLASNEAKEAYAIIAQHGGPPPNTEEDLSAHWMEPHAEPGRTDGLDALLEPIKTFAAQHLNAVPDKAVLGSVLPRLQELHDAITNPTTALDSAFETEATNELMRASARIAHSDELTNEQPEQLIPIVLRATTHASPEPDNEENQLQPVTAWSDAPRIVAAQTIILLARYPAGCTNDVRTAIQRLSIDPVRVVRLQIASYLGCLYRTAPDLLWKLLAYNAATEPNPTILADTLNTLRRMPKEHATRTATLTEQIFNRTTSDTKKNDVHNGCIHVFTALLLYANEATSGMIIERLIADPASHAKDLDRLILDLSGEFTATEQPIRETAFALTQRAVTNIISALREVEAANHGLATWPTTAQQQYTGLMHCAAEVAQRLFFASGAFTNSNNDRTFLPPGIFYQHARPLIVLLADIGHPHIAHHLLDALKHFIAVDPPGVLVLVGDVVRAGSKYGYQYEQLAEGLMVEIVEQYLAQYRTALRDHTECNRALMDILDVFVRLGWPRAHQLAYRLNEIYR